MGLLSLQLCSLILSTWVGLPHSFICTRQAVPTTAQLVVRAPQLSIYPPILGQPHRLPADARISWICMPLSQRCPPLPLLYISLVSYNCTLLPALFTPVAAPVPNHSHPVCARAAGSVHSLVAWASLCLGSPPLHGGAICRQVFSPIFPKLIYLKKKKNIMLNLLLICVCMCVCVCVCMWCVCGVVCVCVCVRAGGRGGGRVCVYLSVSACACVRVCVRACVCLRVREQIKHELSQIN